MNTNQSESAPYHLKSKRVLELIHTELQFFNHLPAENLARVQDSTEKLR